MARNLDMTALRSFVAVAEAGGVTRAAGYLNLTQSAVSMQLKRLEDALQLTLLDRSARKIALTGAGEQFLGYARRMLHLNDEIFSRLTAQEFEGEIVLGVPSDIVYPSIPLVLRRFRAEYPRVRVHLVSSYTKALKDRFARGKADIILTTEDRTDSGGETLVELPLIWIGAPGGRAWKSRPLQLAYEYDSVFRRSVEMALERAEIPWELAVESDSTRTIEASVSADLAVHTVLEGAEPPYIERIQHRGALPELPSKRINLYVSDVADGPLIPSLAALIRNSFGAN